MCLGVLVVQIFFEPLRHEDTKLAQRKPYMVEVFKTNVEEPVQAEKLVALLLTHFPDGRINFDLQDCDRILRVEKPHILPERIIELVNGEGFVCGVLD